MKASIYNLFSRRSVFTLWICFMAFIFETFPVYAQETLKLAFLPTRSQIHIFKTAGPLISALQKESGIQLKVIGSTDVGDTIEKLKKNEIDIVELGPFAYISAEREVPIQLVARKIGTNGESYESLIIVKKDSGIQNLQDLKGKSISFTHRKSTSGYLYPLLALKNAELKLSDFNEIKYVKRNPNSLIAVYNGQVDAGALASSHFRNQGGANIDKLKIIWKSEPLYHAVFVARAGISDDIIRRIREAMFKITNSPNAKQIFADSTIRGFTSVQRSDYDNVRRIEQMKAQLETTQ